MNTILKPIRAIIKPAFYIGAAYWLTRRMLMAKFAPDAEMDAALDHIALADELWICTTQPANYAGIAALALAGPVTLTPGNGNGDFTIANGDVSGRKLTTAQQAAIPIDVSGSAEHIVLATGGATDLIRAITTCTAQALVDTGTVTVPAWDWEIADPT